LGALGSHEKKGEKSAKQPGSKKKRKKVNKLTGAEKNNPQGEINRCEKGNAAGTERGGPFMGGKKTVRRQNSGTEVTHQNTPEGGKGCIAHGDYQEGEKTHTVLKDRGGYLR